MIKDIFEGNPIVNVKRKHVQAVIDHCLEKKIEFTVKPASGTDEWAIEFLITSVKKAVLLGMFLREAKLELNDISYKSTTKAETKPETVAAAPSNPVNVNGTAAKKAEIKEVSLDSFAPSFSFGEEENAASAL
jgi:hypothetical protein